MVSRFDVFLVDLEPTVGREINKTRPCVIISPDEINSGLWPVLVAPLSSTSRKFPFHLPSSFQGKKGSILFDQMRAVDRRRLVKRLGNIQPKGQQEILDCLQTMFS